MTGFIAVALLLAPTEPLFEGVGTHTRPVKCGPAAQRYFDQGLAFLYAFNHDEAIRSFTAATLLSRDCAMAYWGIAMANGPHINNPMVPEPRARAAFEALQQARMLLGTVGPSERALISALEKRYADPQPKDRLPLDQAYADAMREVAKAHPKDADVQALFAEAMMDLRPWDFWTKEGKSQPGTPELVEALERALKLQPKHPLANHLLIHALEASPEPKRADPAAERLRTLQPGLGHMVHMPTHIDVRLGRWQRAIDSNAKAIEADRAYRARSAKPDFYNLYMSHNRHMLGYAAMMSGQSELALEAMRDMVAAIPDDWKKESAAIADGFVAMPIEVLIRFGRWEELLAEPEPPEYLPLARALRHYGRGVAHVARGHFSQARAEQAALENAKAQLPEGARFGNNESAALLGIAEKVLAGELLFAEGRHEQALAELEEAVKREDQLRYGEPPDWIHPVRHAYGAALIKAGQVAHAEQVYREDLAIAPENVWSLHGLARALRLQKRETEARAVERRLNAAQKKADVKLTSSCMCLPGI